MSYISILNMTISGILPSVLGSLVFYYCYYKKRQTHNGFVFCFIFYLLMLFYVTIYRYGISIAELSVARSTPNLIPFVSTYQLSIYSGWDIFYYNIIGNIMWFLPFGFLLPHIQKQYHIKEILFCSFLLSLSIEISQFVLNCGISDVDDLIFNVLGGCLGYWVFVSIKNARKI